MARKLKIFFITLLIASALPVMSGLANNALSRTIMVRKTLVDGRDIIMQGGKAYYVNSLGVKKQAQLNAQYKTTDGFTVIIHDGNGYLVPPKKQAASQN